MYVEKQVYKRLVLYYKYFRFIVAQV